MTHEEIFDLCKRMLPQVLETEQEGNGRYLFLTDNDAITEALLSFGYGAALISGEGELGEIRDIFSRHAADMYHNNIRIIPLCRQSVIREIGAAVNNKGMMPGKSYTIYGRKKAYYEANPYKLEEPVRAFVESLESPPTKNGLKMNPSNGLIIANVEDNPYRAIAEHIVAAYDIVILNEELRIRREGRFYELYTPDKNESVLINALDNSSGRFRKEVYRYIKEFAPRRELSKNLIPFLNCVYDYKEMDIRDYTEDMYFTDCIPHRVNMDAEIPDVLDKFLSDISSGDEEIEGLLIEIIAYCLINGNPWQKMFFIYGSGGNGKSTFFKLLKWIFGSENVEYKCWEDLREAKGRYGIEDKRVVICDDEYGTFIKNPRALKVLTSEEPLNIKKLYSDEYNVTFRGKIISSGNEIPRTCDRSNGWLRRLVIIPFDGDFRHKPDIFLSEKLRTEETAEALILYALIKLEGLLKNGFSIPDRVKILMREYKMENNHVIQFVEEMGDRFMGKENAKHLATIHKTYYYNFCKDYLYKPFSFMQFAKTFNAVEGIKCYRPRGSTTKLYYYDINDVHSNSVPNAV